MRSGGPSGPRTPAEEADGLCVASCGSCLGHLRAVYGAALEEPPKRLWLLHTVHWHGLSGMFLGGHVLFLCAVSFLACQFASGCNSRAFLCQQSTSQLTLSESIFTYDYLITLIGFYIGWFYCTLSKDPLYEMGSHIHLIAKNK